MPQGKALDISQVGPVEGVDNCVSGSNQFAALQGADVVIVTACVCYRKLYWMLCCCSALRGYLGLEMVCVFLFRALVPALLYVAW